jgi:hypothetical protein
MRRWLGGLLGSAVTQALAALLAAAILALWAIRAGVGAWLTRVPLPLWTGLMGAAAVALMLAGWRILRPRPQLLSAAQVRVTRSYLGGGSRRFEIHYADVVWSCRVHMSAPGGLSWRGAAPDDVLVDGSPRCPKCRTELEERPRRVWRGYTWLCVQPGCGFTRRSRESFAESIGRVEKIACRQVEENVSAEQAKADPWRQDVPS